MKDHKVPTCPGCHRHCPLSNPHCKYGRAYAAKQEKKTKTKCKHPWEKHVTPEGTLHVLLTVTRKVKKALCHQKVTEESLLRVLTEEEKNSLNVILGKLRNCIQPADE